MIKSIITNNKLLIVQSCPTLCNPMDWSLPGSSVHGIFQARILKRVVIPFSRGSFQPRDQTRVSCIAGRFFTTWATRKNHQTNKDLWKSHQMSKKKNHVILFLTKSRLSRIAHTNEKMTYRVTGSWPKYFFFNDQLVSL